jgi:glycosyltransferase involved in cell wall biosynthesis
MTKKVLYLDHSTDFSGGQKSLLALLKVLDRKQFDPVVLVDRKANRLKAELTTLKVEYYEINYINKKFIEYFFVWIPVVQIFFLLRLLHCNLLHCNTFKTGIIGAILTFVSPVKMIFRARLGIIHISHGIVDKIIHSKADVILANSFYVKATFTQRFGDNPKVKVVYNPLINNIEINKQIVTLIKSQYFQDPNCFYFGLIGRIERFKRIEMVLEAAEKLKKFKNNFKVLLIGAEMKSDNGKYARELKGIIKSLQLEEHVVFTGFMSDIWEITSLLDAVIICSVGEALSRGVYEAQAIGIPVIASNSGGNMELISHYESGLLFQPDDANSLYFEMKSLMEDSSLRNKMAKGGQAKVKKLFTDENTILKEMNIYNFILAGVNQ